MAKPLPTPFVRFSTELFDASLRSRMPGVQREVLLAVVRLTYGDHGRGAAAVSTRGLAKMTGRDRKGVQRALDDLLAQHVLIASPGRPEAGRRLLSVQEDYERWGCYTVWSDDVPTFTRHDWQGGDYRPQGTTVPGDDSPPKEGTTDPALGDHSPPSLRERDKPSGGRKRRAGKGESRAANTATLKTPDGQEVGEYDTWAKDDPVIGAEWMRRYGHVSG